MSGSRLADTSSVRMRRLLGILILLTGCGFFPPDFFAFGTNGVFESTQGGQSNLGGLTAVAIWTSDSPVDAADRVWITFDRVLLIKDGRETVLENRRRTLDMLTLQHGIRRQLAEGLVAPGTYDAVRIELATPTGLTSWVEVDDEVHPLLLAAGAEPALEFPAQYRMRPDEEMELQVDFNVRLSVYEVGGNWYLDPTGFIHDPLRAGAIEGTALPAGSVISAQIDGEEVASVKSRADGYFKLTPLQPARYDVVVTHAGYAPAFEDRVEVDESTTSSGHHFLLDPAEPGSIQGYYLAVSSPGLTVRLIWNGRFLGYAGVDPLTGAFQFPSVPPGLLEVEAWDTAGPLGRTENVLVDSGFDSLIEFR